MKFKRVCAVIAISVCLIAFGIWAKITNIKETGAIGGNLQHTYFYDTKGLENIKGLAWKKDLAVEDLAQNIILYKNWILSFNVRSVDCIDAVTRKEIWKYDKKYNNFDTVSFPYCVSTGACYEGIVYFTVGNKILGLDINSGTERWSCENERRYNITELLLQGGILYYGSDDGIIHCLNLKSKRERWKLEIDNSIRNMAYDKGVLYVNTHKNILAVDSKDGKVHWKIDAVNNGALTIGEKCLYTNIQANDDSTRFAAIDRKNGKEMWNCENIDGMLYDSIAYHDGKVYVIYHSYGESTGGIEKSVLKALDENTGKELWNFKSESMLSGISIAQHGFYVLSGKGELISLNPKTGAKAKESTVNMECEFMTSPVIKDSKLYFIGYKNIEDYAKWFIGKVE